jgi:hypothetical protein
MSTRKTRAFDLMAQEQYRLPPTKIITPSKRIKSTELQPIDEENKKRLSGRKDSKTRAEE